MAQPAVRTCAAVIAVSQAITPAPVRTMPVARDAANAVMTSISTDVMRNDFKCNHFDVNDIDSLYRGRAGQKFRHLPAKDRRLASFHIAAG